MKSFLHKNGKNIVIFCLTAGLIGSFVYFKRNETGNEYTIQKNDTCFVDSMGIFHKIYKEGDFADLKEDNKTLYDSLKSCKDQISYLVKFKYEMNYTTDTVFVGNDTVKSGLRTFTYNGGENDTITYRLRINSREAPQWYMIDFALRNEFLIVNRKDGSGMNSITIDPNGTGTISDVTTLVVKDKEKLLDRFKIGPSVGIGYGLTTHSIDIYGGVSITYNLW